MAACRSLLALAVAAMACQLAAASPAKVGHVLVLFFDGMHNSDLAYILKHLPHGNFAKLAKSSTIFTEARHAANSDSYPSENYFFTGAGPVTTGVWYDVSYDSTLYPPGTDCTGPVGTVADLSEVISINADDPYGGGGINTTFLPRRKTANGCEPVYPHQYVRVNNVFEVVKQNVKGAYTAFCDKHLGFEFLQGKSGKGVDDLNNLLQVAPYSKDPKGTRAWDAKKAEFVINQIKGRDSNNTKDAPVPTLYGANFQSISVNQKLPNATSAVTNTTQKGGYIDAEHPNALVKEALEYSDEILGMILDALAARKLLGKTAIFVAGKHGQSPVARGKLESIDPDNFGKVAASINVTIANQDTDTGCFLWLSPADRKAGKAKALAAAINKAQASGKLDLGLEKGSAKAYLGPDPRHPDVIALTRPGTLYSTKSIEDHGSFKEEDVHVALMVSVPRQKARVQKKRVTTSQVAPTILNLLGVSPNKLEGVRIEKTKPLP